MVSLDQQLQAAPLSHASLHLADTQVFAYHQGLGTSRYLHWEALWNAQGTGLMQRLMPIEEQLFHLSESVIANWRKQGAVNLKEMTQLYNALETQLREYYPR